jgi:hypothetical protein
MCYEREPSRKRRLPASPGFRYWVPGSAPTDVDQRSSLPAARDCVSVDKIFRSRWIKSDRRIPTQLRYRDLDRPCEGLGLLGPYLKAAPETLINLSECRRILCLVLLVLDSLEPKFWFPPTLLRTRWTDPVSDGILFDTTQPKSSSIYGNLLRSSERPSKRSPQPRCEARGFPQSLEQQFIVGVQ